MPTATQDRSTAFQGEAADQEHAHLPVSSNGNYHLVGKPVLHNDRDLTLE